MDTTGINIGAASTAAEKPAVNEPLAVSEQLQTLSLYLYLDARRYGSV